MELRITINMDNAAFGYDASNEVSGILHRLAEKTEMDYWDLAPGDTCKLIDANGNTVGEWEVTDDTAKPFEYPEAGAKTTT
jgi:hypothetical protein